ncbi:MAG: ABC transporter permease [Gemmatimonadetes bacterium]|nr:ABC transporter permease [Gemmatimonadota bacterium]
MSLGLLRRLYRRLLIVLPADFRRRNASAMEEAFGEALEGSASSRVGRLGTLLSAAGDVVAFAVLARWRWFTARRSGRAHHSNDHSPNKEPPVLKALARDAWFTIRSFRKAPAFAAVAILTIGLGIGATTLVFSVVYGVLLRPLPYDDSDRLVNVWNDLIEERQFLPAVHPADFRDYQQMSETFQEFAAASGAQAVGVQGVLTGEGPPQHVDASSVTHNFFRVLGVDPILGRHFTEDEEAVNGPNVVILSHELWSTRYGRDSSLVGKSVQLDSQPYTVVGVLPAGFRLLLPDEAFLVKHSDLWVPLQQDYNSLPPRNWTWFTVLGRLQQDIHLEQAQAEMDRIAEELRATYPAHANSGMQIRLVPFHHDIVKQARPALLTLFGAVGFVLLIACANVAHLLLLRGAARQKELAVRSALGASRTTIMRQLLTESVVIGVLGAGFGLLLTNGGLQLLTALQPPNLPRLTELGMSGAVWGFATAAALATAAVFGLAPAYHASRTDMTDVLKEGARSGRTRGTMRARNLLVIGEIAISLVLLVGTGLMIRSFKALQDVEPGFEPSGALTFRVSLPNSGYPGGTEIRGFFDELHTQLAGLPGVQAVGGVSQLPLTGSTPLWPYAYDDETASNFNLSADGKTVTDGYFDAMGARLLEGRAFTTQDHAQSDPVVIVEEMLARRAWPNESPIGQQLQILAANTFVTVVGVVEHMRNYDLREDLREQIYVPLSQRSSRNVSMVVRTAGEPMSLAPAVRNAVWAIDESLPVDNLRPLEAYTRDAMGESQFTLMLMTVFGGLALVLAAVGIYGVISYAVDQRSHEFGIRIALGARPERLVRSVMASGTRLVLASIGIGTLASLALARSLEGLLFEVSAFDPGTYAAVAVVLAAVALLACYLPARRTASSDPVATLKSE